MLKQSSSYNDDGVASNNNPDFESIGDRNVNNSKSMNDVEPAESYVDQISESVINSMCPNQNNGFSPKQTHHSQMMATASRNDSFGDDTSRNPAVHSPQRMQHTENSITTMVSGDEANPKGNWCNACPDGIIGNFTGQIFRPKAIAAAGDGRGEGENAEDLSSIVNIKGRGMGSSLIDDPGSFGGGSQRRPYQKENMTTARRDGHNGNSPERTYHPKIMAKVMATADNGEGEKEDTMDTIAISTSIDGSIHGPGSPKGGSSPRRSHQTPPMKTARRNSITKNSVPDDVVIFEAEQNTNQTPVDEADTESGCLCCPKVASMPTSAFLCLTVAAAIPAMLYIIAFTKMGYGLEVFSFIDTELYPYAYGIGGGVLVYAIILYFLDCFHWGTHDGMIARRNLMLLLAAGVLAFITFISSAHPYGPIAIILVATTIWMVSIRFLCFRNIEKKKYISWLSGPLLLVSAAVGLYWIVWTFLREENEWTIANSLLDAEKAGCDPDFIAFPDCEYGEGKLCLIVNPTDFSIDDSNCGGNICTQVYSHCPNTFIIWAGPFLVTLGFFFLSFFASFLRGDGSTEQSIGKLAKIWMFLLFGIWVSSSLAGAGAGVSAALAALTLAAFVASAIFLAAGYDEYEREEHAMSMWEGIKEKYGSCLDPARGLLIITCTPVAFLYFLVSVLKQSIRSCNSCGQKPPTDTESLRDIAGVGWVTVEARRLFRIVRSWDRAKVFTYAIYWGIGFMILSVIVSEFTIVFLSWLIEKTTELNIATVTGILCGAGMIMFLLPPVPGVPIYLTLGIVIIPVGRENLGIIGSIVYAMVVSLSLKLLACTVQQKVIGGLLKHKVGVRQFVGINTKLIRSMKLVLREPGFGVAKVAILIGGPDWPTSVLCGIMNLPLIPILVGTLPVVLLILPTLLTGSFTYMAGLRVDGQQEFPWATTMATVSAAITALVQFGSMILAAFYLETTVATRGEELESIAIDIPVQEADTKQEELDKAYDEVTQWHRLHIVAKTVLSLSLICMITCCYLVQLFADDCFVEYQLTYTISEHLNGDWKNIVLPLGTVALILFGISAALLLMFTSWAKRGARKQRLSVSEYS